MVLCPVGTGTLNKGHVSLLKLSFRALQDIQTVHSGHYVSIAAFSVATTVSSLASCSLPRSSCQRGPCPRAALQCPDRQLLSQ